MMIRIQLLCGLPWLDHVYCYTVVRVTRWRSGGDVDAENAAFVGNLRNCDQPHTGDGPLLGLKS